MQGKQCWIRNHIVSVGKRIEWFFNTLPCSVASRVPFKTYCSLNSSVFKEQKLNRDCRNRVPQTESLKHWKCSSHHSRGWDVQDGGAGGSGLWSGSTSCLVGGHLFLCPHGVERTLISPLSLLIRALISLTTTPPSWPSPSQRPHLWIRSGWGLRFQHLGEDSDLQSIPETTSHCLFHCWRVPVN